MARLLPLTLLVSGLVASASACASSAPHSERRRGTANPIINGAESGSEHDSVVYLAMHENGQLAGACTGTLVAANLVLTARHCVSKTESSVSCSGNGSPTEGGGVLEERDAGDILVYTGSGGIAEGQAGSEPQGRGVQIVHNDGQNLCAGDIAFVVLDRDLDAPVSAIRLDLPDVGGFLTAAGFGITESGSTPNRRLTREASVLEVGPSDNSGLTSAEFMISESGCSGDSGGPVFNAEGEVVGVFSRVSGGNGPDNAASFCVGESAFAILVNLGSFADVVTTAFEAAGKPTE